MRPRYHFKSNSSYRFKQRLGRGGSAEVLLYSRETPGMPSQDVVLKVIKDRESALEELINDGKRLSHLRHPHIVATFGFEKLGKNIFGLLLEYIRGSDLKKLIPRIPPHQRQKTTAYVVQKMAEALTYAHEQGIIHGDISTRNILVSHRGVVKLSDFGLSIKSQDLDIKKSSKVKGSIDYWSPERWEHGQASMAGDVFSLGIVAYEILSGENPLRGATVHQTRHGLEKFLKSKKWNEFTEWRLFFEGVFLRDSKTRVTACELKELIPIELQNQIEQQMILAECFNHGHPVEYSSRTITVMVDGLLKQPRLSRNLFWAGLLFMFIGLLPFAIGTDHGVAGRLRPYAITITSDPWGEVFVDDRSVGYTPLLNFSVKSGAHSLVWRDYQGHEVRKSIMAFENGSVFLSVIQPQKKRPPFFESGF